MTGQELLEALLSLTPAQRALSLEMWDSERYAHDVKKLVVYREVLILVDES